MDNNLWARISHDKKGWCVELTKSKSPLAEVVDWLYFSSRAAAEKAKDHILKDMGKTYGGWQ